jgi:hypothetical protein
MLNDPTPQRVSACPVHFIWDGRGRGRGLVRGGFLGLIVAGMVGTLSAMSHSELMRTGAMVVLGASLLSYSLGQAISFVVARRG